MEDRLATQAVDAISGVYGAHAGHRAAHAKGVLCAGVFTATPAASRLSRAAHLEGAPVRATVRFSNGSGDPGVPDYSQDGRGMSVKLYLPDGRKTDTVALTLPVFFVRTPEDFVEFTRTRAPDPATGKPDLERVGAWVGRHPEALPAIEASLSAERPKSYAHCRYNGIHAFRWVNGEGAARHVRFSWEPEAGVASVLKEEARERGPEYLTEELADRLSHGPVAFQLVVQLAERGDPVDDPTAAWPAQRETVVVGRLEVTGPETDRERDGDILVFDPTRVVDGIELTDDPILNFRPRAYSVSVERRTGVPAPGATG